MMDTYVQQGSSQNRSNYDREKELKAFDDLRAGVKGLVDAGIVNIPRIFVKPPSEGFSEMQHISSNCLQIPVIDLKDMYENTFRRKEIIEEILQASETWGFFQVVNHGISRDVMEEMIEGVRRFNEQQNEVKMEYYTRDDKRKVKFMSNFDLYQAKFANWRDTLVCLMAPDAAIPEELPAACREIMVEYSKHIKSLGLNLFELLSEALGLDPKHLIDMECARGQALVSHYYPPCPEPDRTLGTTEHSDPDFFTILLQDQIGGLQLFHQNQWVDISPVVGALVVNLGDLLQLISNDKFKSAKHRVLANRIGPRISVACFFTTHLQPFNRLYGPIEELLSEDNPPLYRETLVHTNTCNTIATTIQFGLLGNLNTVSSFILEFNSMKQSKHPWRAYEYAATTISIFFCLGIMMYSVPVWTKGYK